MSYIPTRDSDLDSWAANWTTKVTASPTTYGLTTGIASTMAALFGTWHTAYLTATAPATRTVATVAAKDSAKGAMVPLLRLYSQQVKANGAVSNSDKTALGIHIDDPVPSPIPAPSTQVITSVREQGPQFMSLNFADSLTPASRAKPAGAIGALVYVKVGTAPSSDPSTAIFDGLYTRSPFQLNFANGDVGKYASIFARWTNGKGEEGPWGTPLVRVIA